uniref:De novo design mini-binder n=1 Tax=synthetic construct TaxID=32630 RepID=UPI00355C9EDF
NEEEKFKFFVWFLAIRAGVPEVEVRNDNGKFQVTVKGDTDAARLLTKEVKEVATFLGVDVDLQIR